MGCMSGDVHNLSASAALLALPWERINAKVYFVLAVPWIIESSHDMHYEPPNNILLAVFTA